MGENLEDTGEGGRGWVEIGTLLPVNSAVNPDFWLGVVGGDPPQREDPGGLHHWLAKWITGKEQC